MKPWMPLVTALALAAGLAGCDSGDETPTSAEGEGAQQTAGQPAEPAPASEATAEPIEAPSADQTTEAPPASEATIEPPEGPVTGEAEVAGEAEIAGEARGDAETAGAPPAGETSRSDVDAILEETERRFEEASRRIDEQFEQAERQRPESEPIPEAEDAIELESVLEASSPLPDEVSTVPDGLGDEEVDAIIEETEQRFEEASRQIEAQFQEAERRTPGGASESESESSRPGEE